MLHRGEDGCFPDGCPRCKRGSDGGEPVDEREMYDQRPEGELYDPGPDPEARRRGGWGGW